MSRIWSDVDRQRQADVCRRFRVWEKSTGPISAGGKAISSQNAWKSGLRSRAWKELSRALKNQKCWLEDLTAPLN